MGSHKTILKWMIDQQTRLRSIGRESVDCCIYCCRHLLLQIVCPHSCPQVSCFCHFNKTATGCQISSIIHQISLCWYQFVQRPWSLKLFDSNFIYFSKLFSTFPLKHIKQSDETRSRSCHLFFTFSINSTKLNNWIRFSLWGSFSAVLI